MDMVIGSKSIGVILVTDACVLPIFLIVALNVPLVAPAVPIYSIVSGIKVKILDKDDNEIRSFEFTFSTWYFL